MTNDVPDLKSELERKTIETVERCLFDLTKRKITITAAVSIIKTLWDMAAGLISQETMELIAATARILEQKYHQMSPPDQVYVGILGEACVVITRHGVGVGLDMYLPAHTHKHYVAPQLELHPDLWAAEHFKKLVDHITAKNYKRVV